MPLTHTQKYNLIKTGNSAQPNAGYDEDGNLVKSSIVFTGTGLALGALYASLAGATAGAGAYGINKGIRSLKDSKKAKRKWDKSGWSKGLDAIGRVGWDGFNLASAVPGWKYDSVFDTNTDKWKGQGFLNTGASMLSPVGFGKTLGKKTINYAAPRIANRISKRMPNASTKIKDVVAANNVPRNTLSQTYKNFKKAPMQHIGRGAKKYGLSAGLPTAFVGYDLYDANNRVNRMDESRRQLQDLYGYTQGNELADTYGYSGADDTFLGSRSLNLLANDYNNPEVQGMTQGYRMGDILGRFGGALGRFGGGIGRAVGNGIGRTGGGLYGGIAPMMHGSESSFKKDRKNAISAGFDNTSLIQRHGNVYDRVHNRSSSFIDPLALQAHNNFVQHSFSQGDKFYNPGGKKPLELASKKDFGGYSNTYAEGLGGLKNVGITPNRR